MLTDVLAPTLGRNAPELAARPAVGTPDHGSELLRSYADAGAREILLWPIHDPINQLRPVRRNSCARALCNRGTRTVGPGRVAAGAQSSIGRRRYRTRSG